jgi:hypothetical protein
MIMIRFAKSHHDYWSQHSLPFVGWLCFRAGHATLPMLPWVCGFGSMALGVDTREQLTGGLFVFFVFGG